MFISKPTKCKRVDIIRIMQPDSLDDGFGTIVHVDGKFVQGKRDKEITLRAVAGNPCQIAVLWDDNTTEVFEPEEFELNLGCLHVEIHPDRRPCKISVGGYEPRVYSLEVKFETGAAPWVDLRFHPRPAAEAVPVHQGDIQLDPADEPVMVMSKRRD